MVSEIGTHLCCCTQHCGTPIQKRAFGSCCAASRISLRYSLTLLIASLNINILLYLSCMVYEKPAILLMIYVNDLFRFFTPWCSFATSPYYMLFGTAFFTWMVVLCTWAVSKAVSKSWIIYSWLLHATVLQGGFSLVSRITPLEQVIMKRVWELLHLQVKGRFLRYKIISCLLIELFFQS